MRFMTFLCLILTLGLAFTGCERDGVVSPASDSMTETSPVTGIDPQSMALEMIGVSGWPIDPSATPERPPVAKAASPSVSSFERIPLTDGVVHYKFTLRVGDGPYDLIGLHRVVKERHSNRPIRTDKNVFMLHGSPGDFEGVFLFGAVAETVPEHLAIALFMAKNGVDVWGIDQSHNFVPEEETDFSFMADWGIQHDVDNLRTGIAVARLTRLLTGSGFATMNLLGYSTGATTGYAALNHETQLPTWERQVGGFIAVDDPYKTDDEAMRAGACAAAANSLDLLNNGVYANNGGQLFVLLGFLAETDPGGPSPIVPGFTNEQAALFVGAVSWAILGSANEFHFWAGTFDPSGFPIDFAYTTTAHANTFAQLFKPYFPTRYEYEEAVVRCGEVDLPYDDHLATVTVPVMYAGAQGGFGDDGIYTTTLLGSTDVTILNVQLQPDELRGLDVGHIDIFTAALAEHEFWQPMLDWLDDHTPSVCGDERRMSLR